MWNKLPKLLKIMHKLQKLWPEIETVSFQKHILYVNNVKYVVSFDP